MRMADLNSGGGDPFDEFEFKPLTDGLGFHKKAVSLKENLKKTGVALDELQTIPTSVPRNAIDDIPPAPTKKHSFDDILSSLEKSPLPGLSFTETLPREGAAPAPAKKAMELDLPVMPPAPRAPVQSPFPVSDVYKNPPAALKKVPAQADLASVGTRRGAADSPQRKLMPATISVASAALDLMVVTAFALIFLVALLTVTKVNLNAVLANLNRDAWTQVSLGVLFIAVMQMYVVISRAFFGATLGEWTFDLQIGHDEEQAQESYPLKVAFRSVINVLTGIVLLPLVSALVGRDIAGQISGVKLYRQRT